MVKAIEADITSAILAERGKRYGKFEDHARITQRIKNIMAHPSMTGDDPTIVKTNWNTLALDQKEALEMIAHKIGRILNGDPNYADSWADIAGYARLVADRLEGKNQ